MTAERSSLVVLQKKIAELESLQSELQAENASLRARCGNLGPAISTLQLPENIPILEAILDITPETIAVTDTHGRIIVANKAMGRRFGVQPAQLIGTVAYDLFPAEIAASRRSCAEKAIESGLPVYLEDERNNKIIGSHINPIKNAAGAVSHLAIFAMDVTEKRRAEEKLAANQALLNASQELTHIGGWEYNTTTGVMTWTDETYRIHGLSPGKLPDGTSDHIASSLSCYFPEDRPTILAAFQNCVERGQPYDLELPFRTLSGRHLWIRTIGTPTWQGNKIVTVRGNIADITERKQKENLLKASFRISEAAAKLDLPELLRMILDETESLTNSRSSFFHLYDEEQQTISLHAWSTATEEICTIDNKIRHYPLAKAGIWADCIRERRPVIHNNLNEVSLRQGLPAGHPPLTRELMFPVFSGKAIVAILGIGNKEEDYDLRDIEIVSTLANLATEIILRKQAEMTLRDSEEKYRNLSTLLRSMCDNVPDMIWAKDLDKRYIFANKALCRILLHATDTQEPKGKDDLFFALRQRSRHPDDPTWHTFGELCRDSDQIVMDEKVAKQFDEYGNIEGKFVFLDVRKAPFIDTDGQTIGTVGSARDITELKKSEEILRQSLAEKEVLLREVHHRVKNNMAAIIGLFDLQRHAMTDPKAETLLTELSCRVRAMSLVHEKLYRSQSLSKIDFQDYTQSLISYLRTSFGSPAIACKIEAEEVSMPLDLAVPCGMIINELVTNALKYAFPKQTGNPGSPSCNILVALSHKDDIFSLTVADNGVGLPEDFEWASTTSLGLTLVRMLGQHQLGGCYTLDRSGGTRFTLTFSLRDGNNNHV